MVGLFEAQRTGVGRDVDISLLDTAVSMLSYFAVWTLNRDWIPERTRHSAHQTLVPAQNLPNPDPSIAPARSCPAGAGGMLGCWSKVQFGRDRVAVVGAPELADDPRFRGFGDRFAH